MGTIREVTRTVQPLAGLRLPNGEITSGTRPKRTLRRRNARVARAFNLAGKRVLDIGCAEGLHSLYMAESADRVIGIDHRRSAILQAEATRDVLGLSNVQFRCGDVRDVRMLDDIGKVDLVVMWGLLHRIADVFSLLHAVAPITDALSLEWRTPVLPLMSRLSVAYHPPLGTDLDPTNLGSAGALADHEQTRKVEGRVSFWEPTPGAVRAICARLGLGEGRILGFGDDLVSQRHVVRRMMWRRVREIMSSRFREHPFGIERTRVHMLFERVPGSLEMGDPNGKDIRLPAWDAAMHGDA